jgi:hypothetical protein
MSIFSIGMKLRMNDNDFSATGLSPGRVSIGYEAVVCENTHLSCPYAGT